MERGGWLLPLRKLLGDEAFPRAPRAYAKSLACGNQWPQERVFLRGRSADDKCQRCRLFRGSLRHRHLECEASSLKRLELLPPLVRESLEGASAAMLDRLLLPDPGQTLRRVTESEAGFRFAPRPPEGVFSGSVFLDGSGYGQTTGAPRSGWAAVALSNEGVAVGVAYGAVLGPIQTVAHAELWALVMVLQLCFPPILIFSDCKYVVEGVRCCKRLAGTPGQRHAHLWRRVWASLREIGEQNELGEVPGLFEIRKTKAHATQADIDAHRSSWFEKTGNDAADVWAKRGALLHKVPPRYEQALKLGKRRALHLARSVATLGSEAAWGKFPDSTVRELPGKKRGPGGMDEERRPRKSRRRLTSMLGRVGERAAGLSSGSACHRVWRSEVLGGHRENETVLWCSKCGAYSRGLCGKPQLLAGLCAERPLTKSKAQELSLLKKGMHPAHRAKNQRKVGENSRLPLGIAKPVLAEEVAEAKGVKREAAADANVGVRRLRVEQGPSGLNLAQWCREVGLCQRDFAQDDRRQALKRKRRLRGKFAAGLEGTSEESH